VTWLNPWAFAGLLALAIPVLIHLLGRRNARVQAFPTLRFLGESRAVSTSRTRLTDLSLLAVRVAILAAVVMALARPLVLTVERRSRPYRTPARAIIVDTSVSMRRATLTDTGPRTAIELARGTARNLIETGGTAVVIETAHPAGALAGAAAWLETRTGPPSITVLSDFQRGSLDSGDVAVVPPHIGVWLRLIEVADSSAAITVVTSQRGNAVTATITPIGDRTDVEWSSAPDRSNPLADVSSLAGSGERASADAALVAARAFTVLAPADSAHPIAIVHRQAERRATLLARAKPLRSPWQGDAIARIQRDETFIAASADAVVIDDDQRVDSASATPLAVVSRTREGRPVAVAAAGEIDGREHLLLFLRVDAGSLASAALISAALRANSPGIPSLELEPATLSRETLIPWMRPSGAGPARLYGGDTTSSDGRWFWLTAIALLAVEWRMRRSRRIQPALEVRHERAA
jgi:hypothetical protein